MKHYLYENFLKSLDTYRETEGFWYEWCDKLIRRLGVEAHWRSRCSTVHAANGQPLLDGNPIASYKNDHARRVLLIVQYPPSARVPILDAWTKIGFGDTMDEPDAFELLSISCVLCNEVLPEIERLITVWVNEKTSRRKMEAAIKTIPERLRVKSRERAVR
jgi:hypothetical protein